MAESAVLKNLEPGLKAVDNVLSFAKSGAGKPSAKERSLFVGSIALSYAVWENFAEDLAVEAITFVAEKIDPADVPEAARKFTEQGTNALGAGGSSGLAPALGGPCHRACERT